MKISRPHSALLLALPVLAASAHAAQLDSAALGGWKPMVTLWGGDVQGAVQTLDKVTQALSAAIHKYEIDKPTQKFIDGVLDELHDFDLDGVYKLLPDERDGGRELNVKGALTGDRYLISRAEPGSKYFVSMTGPRSGLADFSLYVHADQRENSEMDSLVVGGAAGLGVGPLSYRHAVEAQRELLRIVTTGNADAGATQSLPKSGLAREAVRETNPGLGDEDIDALALLFDAYPTLARALIDLGRVEDIRVADTGKNYFHITTSMRAEPKRMEKKYPALARHARRLADILTAKARLLDDKGRDLARFSVDSEKLQLTIEVYVRDGQLLPFDDNQVYENEPFDPMVEGQRKFSLTANARINMLGIVVNIKNLRGDAMYEAHDSYASATATMTNVPKLKVEGRALGLFSPGFLDIFIPSNIQDITEQFFRVVAKGNDGKGSSRRRRVGRQDARRARGHLGLRLGGDHGHLPGQARGRSGGQAPGARRQGQGRRHQAGLGSPRRLQGRPGLLQEAHALNVARGTRAPDAAGTLVAAADRLDLRGGVVACARVVQSSWRARSVGPTRAKPRTAHAARSRRARGAVLDVVTGRWTGHSGTAAP
ncbi:MAG: hypothetical protein QM778_38480 [Myxococcales bacterium]